MTLSTVLLAASNTYLLFKKSLRGLFLFELIIFIPAKGLYTRNYCVNPASVIVALLLGLTWLLPIHQYPWTSFHSDAWMAGVLLAASWIFLLRQPQGRQPWPLPALLALLLSLVPIVQLGLGLIRLDGIAWLSCVYLIGFCMAVLAGARLQQQQVHILLDTLFLALGMAATFSVALQGCQWLRVTDGCLCAGTWVLVPGDSSRPSANLAQVNNLATLMIWGLLAYGWAWYRKVASALLVCCGAVLLLVGLVLTQSRTGLLELGLVAIAAHVWRANLPSKTAPKIVSIFFLLALLLTWFMPEINAALALEFFSSLTTRTRSEPRLQIWTMFLQASWLQPWLGHGWSQTLLAQAIPTTVLPPLVKADAWLYNHSHNLFVDLIVWLGIPAGLGLTACICGWVGRAAWRIRSAEQVWLLLLLLAVGIHAMLELPLHHAYFLLPAGLAVGALAQLQDRSLFFTGHKATLSLWLVATAVFVIIVVDYFKVEESYNELRLERSRVLSKVPRLPPDVILLTQLRDMIVVARLPAVTGMSADQIRLVESVALNYPTSLNLLKWAAVLGLNGRPAEAAMWLARLCELSRPDQCAYSKNSWLQLQNKNQILRAIKWPEAEN